MKYAAVIVGRKGSHRIPNKIYQEVGGEPLILRKVRQCREALLIDKVYVGTDADDLKEQIEALGGIFCRMPDEFCQGNDPSGMIKNVLGFVDADHIVWAHPTNPFLEGKDYDQLIIELESMRERGYKSLFTVTEMKGHFWHGNHSPINFPILEPRHTVAAQLRPVYAQDGAVFIRPHKDMLEDGLFVARPSFMRPIPELKGWDIDYPWELKAAQMFVNMKYEELI